ncbi:Ger(x)C family spore germination protein [Paenibacillus hodogayensis]|uniref:Ger(X)C family spore germination protein n=1 Tax=Paenibacillus hodogayensis TaxID=279208 RepID=A0ABV5W1N5_9BACL
MAKAADRLQAPIREDIPVKGSDSAGRLKNSRLPSPAKAVGLARPAFRKVLRCGLGTAVLFAAMLLGGCWDRTEVNDIAIVLGAGVDKFENGFRVSVLIPLPGNMGGATGGSGGSGGNRPYTVDTETGRTIREAFVKLQERNSRRLFSGHRKLFIIGEAAAKDGLTDLMDITARVPENRLTSYIVIAKGQAEDVLNAAPKLERFPAEALREMLKADAGIQVKDVATALSGEGQDAVLPYVEVVPAKMKDKPGTELRTGLFVFTKQSKMIGTTKPGEANGVRWLKGIIQPYLETIRTEAGLVSVTVRRGQCEIKPRVEEGRLRFVITAKGEATITEAQDEGDYENKGNTEKLERLLERRIRSDITAVGELIKEHSSDIAGFGAILSRTYPSRWKSEWRNDWPSLLTQLDLDVQVEMNVNRTGMFSKNIGSKDRRP